MSSPAYNIVFASDNGCATGLGVAIFSLLEHAADNRRLSIYILDGGISDTNKKMIEAMVSDRGAELAFIDMKGKFAGSRVDHLSEAAYYRLRIAEVLPSEVQRVLYADVDVLFLGDLEELFNTDMQGFSIAAVADVHLMQNNRDNRFTDSLGLSPESPYFNTGVILMDLEKWRNNDLVERCLAYERGNRSKLLFHDQDVLNVVLEGDVAWLHPKWNMFDLFMHSPTRRKMKRKPMAPYSVEMFEEAAANPKIMHFTGSKKPWHYFNKSNREKLYLEYMYRSPWAFEGQKGYSFGRAVKKNLRRLRMKAFGAWS